MKRLLLVFLLFWATSCNEDDMMQYFPNAQIALSSLHGTYSYEVRSQIENLVTERGGVVIKAYSEPMTKNTINDLPIDIQGEMTITHQSLTSDTKNLYYIVLHPEENKIWAYECVESQPDKLLSSASVFEYAVPNRHSLRLRNLTQNKKWINYSRIISVIIQ